MVAGALAVTFRCRDGETLTGPDSRATAPTSLAGAGASASPSRSGSASPPRTVVLPGERGRKPIGLGPRPTVSPPEGLSGRWTGTMTFYADPSGGGPPCERVTPITVDLVQSGGSLTGQFSASCHGTLVLHGTLGGEQLIGSLDDSAARSYGQVDGTAFSDRIQFRTVQEVVNDDGDNSADDYFTSTRVDLHR